MIFEYDHNDHYEQVKSWYLSHGLVPLRKFPNEGFFVNDVMCAWIIRTDWKFLLLDPLISNPNKKKDVRMETFKKVFDRISLIAFKEGYNSIHAFSNVDAVLELADKFDFKDTGKFNYLTYRL